MKSVYPELPKTAPPAPTEEELIEIAKAIVNGYDSDGDDWDPYTPPGEDDDWKTFQQSYRSVTQLRLVYGIKKSTTITAERKKELLAVLHMTKKADVLVREAVETTGKEIEQAMASEVILKDQAELEQAISSTIIDVPRFAKAFIDVKCEKTDATFIEFKEKYETESIDPAIKDPIIE